MKYLVNRETKEHVIYGSEVDDHLQWDVVDADDEGWIEWRGKSQECPLPDDAKVEVIFSFDGKACGRLLAKDWKWEDPCLAYYRPILPAESNQSLGSPSSMRELLDRPNPGKINTGSFSDSNAKPDVFKRFNAAVAASEQIPALIAEINTMLPSGFEVREKAKAEQLADDMSDWRSWREGDLIMYCGRKFDWWTPGEPYKILMRGGRLVIVADDNDEYGIDGSGLASDCMFKFHSRPVTK